MRSRACLSCGSGQRVARRIRRFRRSIPFAYILQFANITPGNLDVPILGQLTPALLPPNDTLEPGLLEIVSLTASLGGRPGRQEALEHPPRNPDNAIVLSDLDPELHGLPIRVPAGIFGERPWYTTSRLCRHLPPRHVRRSRLKNKII
jgi:hypothetical protein